MPDNHADSRNRSDRSVRSDGSDRADRPDNPDHANGPDRPNRDWARLHAGHVEDWGRRLAEACSACGVEGCVIFSGAVQHRFRDDIEIPYVAEPYFKAWVPETYPGSTLKVVPGSRPQLVCLRTQDFWHLPVSEPGGFWTGQFEIRCVATPVEALRELGDVSGLAAIGESAQPCMGFRSVNDPALLAHLDFHRAVKTPYEVACIEEANRVAASGHTAAQSVLREGASEFGLNQAYCGATGQRESALPYPNIVALNEHAGILHYQHLDRDTPAHIHSFLMDAGADCNGYASDVSRTCAGDTGPFRDLIGSMDAMQRRLCDEARDGTSFVSLHESAHRAVAKVLAEHGIVRCSPEEAYGRGITRTFLPHGLGHLLGLQVHDAGGHLHEPGGAPGAPPAEHPFLRLTRTLRPGFVVTVEPGIYFIPELLDELGNGSQSRMVDWDLVEHLLPCGGIRVEDNVLVTEGGSRNMTRAAFSTEGCTPPDGP
ncbi:MAG: Xaa-Pro dipeptidase [Rhodospirillaceae bacterium]|nr:Xaa-Pro dipeptidase [Rhodospirillaceae bacterium]MDD9998573.1 Xaa-Pro dipeptidase [Rhodospirillaceae bacterium]